MVTLPLTARIFRFVASVERVASTGIFGALLLVSCGKTDTSNATTAAVAASGPVGGTIIEAIPVDAQSLFPPATNNAFDLAVIGSVFDRLADIGNNLNTIGDSGYVPQLASSWTWSKDSLSIAFHLHPNARWHDGVPVRANDVRFTYKTISNDTSGSKYSEYVSNIDSVSVADSLTPVVWFKRRTPHQFFDVTYSMYILPAHLLDTIPLAALATHPLSNTPVGSGRFRFVKWDKLQSIEIAADTANYRGRAKLDRFIWAISGDASAATVSVFSGNADFFEKLQSEELPQALASPKLQVIPYSQVGYSFLQFNFRARKHADQPHPIFSDIRVRRALAMAIDRERLTHAVLDSFAVVSIGPSPRAMFQNPGALKPIGFDVNAARALLDSAGWVLAPGQTIRSKGGVPLKFEMFVQSSSAARTHYAQALEQSFRLVGVAATVRPLENMVLGPRLEGGDFDAYLGALVVTPGLLGIKGSWGTGGNDNYGKYSGPAFDAAADSALGAFKASSAATYWTHAFQHIIDDAPALWLFEETSLALMHRRIRPTPLRADAWYAGLADWTIDPAQRIARDRSGSRGGN